MARRPSPIVQRLALEGGDEVIAELKRLGLAGEVAGRELKKQFDALNKTGLDPFTASIKRAQTQMQDLSKRFSSIGREFTNVGRTMSFAVTAPIVAGFGFAIKAATDFESKMADIARVVEIPTPDGLERLGEALRQMATDIGVSVGDLQDIAQAAGAAGIPFNELAGFTELVAKGAVALNLSFGETGDSLAKIRTALGLTTPQVSDLIDAVALLADEGAAADAEIIGVVQEIGALGKQAGLSELEIAALGSSMIGMGVDAESSGTAIRNMLLNLSSGSEATAGFKSALAQLGLDAEGVAQRLQTDGIGVILDLFERLRQQAPEVRLALLQGLFDRRAAQSLAPIIGNLEELDRQLGLVSDRSNFAGRANEEFARRADTSAQKVREFKAALEELGITVGNELLPTFTDLTEKATELVNAFSNSGPIVRWSVAIAGIAAAIGPVIFAIGQTIGAIGALLKAGALVIGFFLKWRSSLTVVMAGLTLLAAHPVFAVLAALVATGGTLYWLATRQNEAERAAGDHDAALHRLRDAIDAVKLGVPGASEALKELSEEHLTLARNALKSAQDQIRAMQMVAQAEIAATVGPTDPETLDRMIAVDPRVQRQSELIDVLTGKIAEYESELRKVPAVAKQVIGDTEALGDAAESSGGKIIKAFPGPSENVRSLNGALGETTESVNELGDAYTGMATKAEKAAKDAEKATSGIVGRTGNGFPILANTDTEQAPDRPMIDTSRHMLEELGEVSAAGVKIMRDFGKAGVEITSETQRVITGQKTVIKEAFDIDNQFTSELESLGLTSQRVFGQEIPDHVRKGANDIGATLREIEDGFLVGLRDGSQFFVEFSNQAQQASDDAAAAISNTGPAFEEFGRNAEVALDEAADTGSISENVQQVGQAFNGAGESATLFGSVANDTMHGVQETANATATALPGLFQTAASTMAQAFAAAFAQVRSELAALQSAVTAALNAIASSLAAVRREIAATRAAAAAAASAASSSGGGGGFAQGGQVFGPGTSTSDSIPAWLSAREFVQPTASVDYYGVDFMEMVRRRLLPQNVMALIRQAISGARGFRDGGMVLPHFTAPRFEIPRFNTGGMVPAMAGAGNARDMGVLRLSADPAGDGFRMQGPIDVLDKFTRAMNRAGLTKTGRGPARLRG